MLMVEPIGHVTRNHFETMAVLAQEIGFKTDERPFICLSRAVVLEKDGTAG